jgi:predicted ATPase
LVIGLLCATIVKFLRGEDEEAWQLAQKMDALTHEYHLPLLRIAGVVLQGSIAVRRGAWEEGITGMTVGLSQYHAIGAQQLVPFFLSFLAEGYWQQGRLDEALRVVDDALGLTATNFDVFWEAELYQLKGELTLARSSVRSLESSVQKNQKAKIPNPRRLNRMMGAPRSSPAIDRRAGERNKRVRSV